jgi:hypothetical protein
MINRTDRGHTKLCVPIQVPLLEVEVEELNPVEVRSMPDQTSDGVRGGKDPFTCFQVFEPEAIGIQWVELQLATSVVRMAMECIDNETEPLSFSF